MAKTTKRMKRLVFGRDAECGNEIEEQDGDQGVNDEADRKRLQEFNIVAEAAQVVKSGDIKNEEPWHENTP